MIRIKAYREGWDKEEEWLIRTEDIMAIRQVSWDVASGSDIEQRQGLKVYLSCLRSSGGASMPLDVVDPPSQDRLLELERS